MFKRCGGDRLLAHDAVEQRGKIFRCERFFAGQNFVDQHGERELVGAAGDLAALDLLRRHVAGRAHHGARHGHCWDTILATPKSVILAVPSSWIMMLAGLMSR